MHRLGFLLLIILSVAACKKAGRTAPGDAAASAETVDAAAPALPELPWIEDDYAAALAKAKESGKLLVIDFWAPWCHTCLSMKSFVFRDPSLQPLADRFVWLAVNTERPEAAPLLAQYPVGVWPTFFVVNPADESVQGRWLGAASVDQFRAFVGDAELVAKAGPGSELPADDPLRLLVKGHQAAMAGNYADAASSFGFALVKAPADWPRRPDVLVGLIEAQYRSGEYAQCVATAHGNIEGTGRAVSSTDFAYFAFTCAQAAKLDPARKTETLELLERHVAARVADASAPLSADDRGDAYGLLMEIREARGDEAGARKAAEERLAMLLDAASRAPDPLAASTFAWATADTYLTLDRPADAIAHLEKLITQLPEDYSLRHWLARVYLKTGDHAKALAASETALALAYGPRKGRILDLQADIHEAAGDPKQACAALRAQGELYASLPEAQLSKKAREAHAKRIGTLCSAEEVPNVGRLHHGEE